VASEGILGLWRGNSATLLRVLPYAGLHFMTHEALEQHFRKHQEGQRLSPVNRFAAGAGAGALSTLATYPLDVIRARMAVTATAVTPTYVFLFRLAAKASSFVAWTMNGLLR
jgi:solute carrier family 25 protein 42